ncbi:MULTISPECIES: hypothetical protein [Burkholderia]|uniref:hypothetical protein n=1 Tax=Burkholderia TaxID=32008 RepID=UPI000A958557|nr:MULTISPECIES: hypothetical protein [unclassified Burkholderia]
MMAIAAQKGRCGYRRIQVLLPWAALRQPQAHLAPTATRDGAGASSIATDDVEPAFAEIDS